jgi:hypothetical protein
VTTLTPDRADVTDWLVGLLRDNGQWLVGDHKAPAGADPLRGYLVVYSIPGGGVGGPPLGAAAQDAVFVYQVDAVGRTREQAERLSARARLMAAGRDEQGAYHAAADDPVGLAVHDRVLDGSPGSAIAEGSFPNEVYTVSERFAIAVSGV